MDATSKRLVELLETGDIELRMSVIRILSEIGLNSKQVIHSLARCLREEPEQLRVLALRALTKLGARDVLELVVPMVLESGLLRENAMAVVTAAGSPAVPHLCDLYGKADFHGKLSVATTLSRIGGKHAIECLLRVLPDEPFEIQKHITRCICDSLETMSTPTQEPVFRAVLRFLSRKKPEDIQVVVAGLIIFGYFHGERFVKQARKTLLKYVGKDQQGEVRRHALVSFQRLLSDVPLTNDQVATLEKLLCDDDWNNVAQHALGSIQRIELPRQQLLKLTQLLHKSPHFSVHIHIFERLRGNDSREVARAIIPFLRDGRFRVREGAEAALRSIPSAIEDLFHALLKEEDTEVCQRMAMILHEYPQEAKRRFADTAIELFLTLFDQNDGRYGFFFDFAQAIDPEPIRQKIYAKVRALKSGRSKEKWVKVAGYLQTLWDHHLITADGRYLFAVALIHQSTKDLSPAARRANLGLRVIRALIYDNATGLVGSLSKDPDIGAEELFYIGFHFMEEGEEMRPFARAILEHLIKKYPKSRFAAPARAKLDLHLVQTQPPEAAGKTAKEKAAVSKTVGPKPHAVSTSKQAPAPAAPPAAPSAAKTAGKAPPLKTVPHKHGQAGGKIGPKAAAPAAGKARSSRPAVSMKKGARKKARPKAKSPARSKGR